LDRTGTGARTRYLRGERPVVGAQRFLTYHSPFPAIFVVADSLNI
jgi:hypothetical protein